MKHCSRSAHPACLFAAMALALAVAQPAQAAPVTIEFAGFVDVVADGLNILDGLTANGKSTRFTGGLTWDTAAADSDPGPDGLFANAISNLWVQFDNGLGFAQGGPQYNNKAMVANDRTNDDHADYGEPAFDSLHAYAQWDPQLYGSSGYPVLGIRLHSLDLSALAGDELPGFLDLGKFLDPDGLAGYEADIISGDIDKQSAQLELSLTQLNGISGIRTVLRGTIDSGHVVSEPAAPGLATIGLAALAGVRRRKRCGADGT